MLKLAIADRPFQRFATELLSACGLTGDDQRIVSPLLSVVKVIPASDVPRLVREGAFDLAITSTERIREGELEETAARGQVRDLVVMDELPMRRSTPWPKVIWGAPASAVHLDDVDPLTIHSYLDECARFGGDFSYTRSGGVPIQCATDYPYLAREFLREGGWVGHVDPSPAPWDILFSPINAVLSLAEEVDLAGREDIHFFVDDPITEARPCLIANPIAHLRAPRRVAILEAGVRISTHLRMQPMAELHFSIPSEDADAVTLMMPRSAVSTIRQDGHDPARVNVEVILPPREVNRLISALQDHGANEIVQINARHYSGS